MLLNRINKPDLCRQPRSGHSLLPAPEILHLAPTFGTCQPVCSISSLTVRGTTYDELHIISAHPEAIRRRHEAEQRQWDREEERRKEKEQEAKGLSWFEGECPPNFLLLDTRAEFEQSVEQAQESGKLLVANFFTTECYVCKSLYPKLKKIAAEHADVVFVKLNGSNETLRPLFEEVGITRVPFFNLYRNSKVVSGFTASLLPEKLAQLRGEIMHHKRAT